MLFSREKAMPPEVGYQDLRLMEGCPPPKEKLISLNNWDSPPFNRWSFQHMSELFPVARISRGPGSASELPKVGGSSDQNVPGKNVPGKNVPDKKEPDKKLSEKELDSVKFELLDGRIITLGSFLTETYTDGFMVMHKGEVVSEKYFNGMQPNTLHLLQSVSKTMVGSLVGILIGQGKIDPQTKIGEYVPELAKSGYGDARVQDVLDMRTGVKFNEDYTDPNAEFIQLDIASGWRGRGDRTCPDTIYGLLESIPKERQHGEYFQYRSVDSDVLGWVCERTGGARLATLLSREIWSKLGAEQDANVTLDRVGTCLADGGISTSLRDLTRFAQMHLHNGFFNGQQIVPEAFIKASRHGSTEAFKVLYSGFVEHYPNAAYSNQCWVSDSEQGIYSARGVFGQYIYVDPGAEITIVKFSTWPDFLNPEWSVNTYRAYSAISNALTKS